jgi:hypothetical protein
MFLLSSSEEEFEDTEGVIRISKSKKKFEHTHKAKDRVTRTPLNTRGELTCPFLIRNLPSDY